MIWEVGRFKKSTKLRIGFSFGYDVHAFRIDFCTIYVI